jgi:RNA polymerase sigma factor (sigma-70 family)
MSEAGLKSRVDLGAPEISRRELSDADLLQRFSADRDDRAFACLVSRHGPLVMAVCRRVLRDEQDAEDAFQATFLVLARKATSVRSAVSLPAWLHKTAYRIALRARSAAVRRREQPIDPQAMIATETLKQFTAEYGQSVLDEELNRLPEKYRLPLFLVAVEGKSRDEAARQLDCSPGSLKGRLERGRQILRRRLMLRGVSLGAAVAVVLRSQQVAQAAVDPSLVASTVQAGAQYAAGYSAVGYVSQNALTLAKGSSPIMTLSTSKLFVCCVLTLGIAACGGSALLSTAIADGDGASTLVIEGAPAGGEPDLIAFQAAEEPREGDAGERREGDGERRERDVPREGERRDRDVPREGERDAARRDQPREGDRPREGERPRDGERRDAPREGERRDAPREGDRAREGERDILGDFQPQTEREEALVRMIRALQQQVAALRRELAASRRPDAAARDGERRDADIRRDGERRPDAARDRERGDREREDARPDRPDREREGDRPDRPDGEREADRPRDGERPAEEPAGDDRPGDGE